MDRRYLFTSARLGFRNWTESDIPAMAAINADTDVMEFFPSTATMEETVSFIKRMGNLFREKGYCYFAVETLRNKRFIGFIGIAEQTFESPFTPCIDIGWRLGKAHWNQGYATEGAKRCLEYGFEHLGLTSIISVAPKINIKSISVMKKIGMAKLGEFVHPKLLDNKKLRVCVCFEIKNDRLK